MANLYREGCFEDRVYGLERLQLPALEEIPLRYNHVLVGNFSGRIEETELDLTRFTFIEAEDECDTRTLTILPFDHGELLGLDDDDHEQYVHTSIDRTITADHTVEGTWTITNSSPFALSVDGGIRVNDTFYDENSSPGDNGEILRKTLTGVSWVDFDHGELDGLDDDDHEQYIHTSIDRTITANHTVEGTWTITNTSPDALNVAGGIRVNDTFYDENNLPGTDGQIIRRTTTGISWNDFDHGELDGLDDDDHEQYVHVDIDRTITADHTVEGTWTITNTSPDALSVDGGIRVNDTFYDQDGSGGEFGQIVMKTITGVRWVTPSVENTFYVTMTGDDNNDGISELTPKRTIKAALRASHSGLIGQLQDASDQILANRKLIVEEAWGYLLSETGIVFPNELDIARKAREARNLIYTNRSLIITNALATVSGNPGYSNANGLCERDTGFVVRAIAEDIFAGGHDFIQRVASGYFDIEGNYLSSIFTPDSERLLAIDAFNAVAVQIGNILVDPVGQPGYFDYLRGEVNRLVGLLTTALTNLSLNNFPTEEIRQTEKFNLYYESPSLVQTLLAHCLGIYPDIAGDEEEFNLIIEKFIVAITEDLYGMGTKNTVVFLNDYYSTYSAWRPEVIREAVSEFETQKLLTINPILSSYLSYLVEIVDTNIAAGDLNSLPDSDPGYGRTPTSSICKRDIGFFVDAVASDLKNGGNLNCINVGESYYEGANLIHIDGEVTETLATFDRARELMILAMRNWETDALGSLYEPEYSFERIYRDTLLVVDESGYPYCADVETAINNYYQIVEFILQNGPNYERNEARRLILDNIQQISEYVWRQTKVIHPIAQLDEVKCQRDITFILEAIARDLRSNGNNNTLEAAEIYPTIPSTHVVTLTALSVIETYLNSVILASLPAFIATSVTSLVDIIEAAISGNPLPPLDLGSWNVQPPSYKTTIFVRSGEYVEDNPLVIPPNASIFGDNLRSITVRPKNKTQDVFYMNNASYLTGITISDHLFPSFGVSFPQKNGVGVAGIISRSPYVQNCTCITTSGGGMRIDGDLAAGLKSMVLDAFTQYNQGGRGVDIINNGYAQLVSLFTICTDVGVYTATGGQCDLTNSNSSFGDFGLVAEGVGEIEHIGRINYDVPAGETEITISELGVTRPYDGQVIYFGTPYYAVRKITIIDPGSGYITPPAVNFSDPEGPRGVPARARTIVRDGEVIQVLLLREGRNFINPPTVSVDPPPPGGTTAQLAIEMTPIYYGISSSTDIVNGEAIVNLTLPLYHPITKGTSVPFLRQSKILASSHSFQYIGSGADIDKALPINNGVPLEDNEVEARDGGAVIFTSTDQRGNFKIGDGVIIDQVTGTIGGVSFSRGLFAQITPLIIGLQ